MREEYCPSQNMHFVFKVIKSRKKAKTNDHRQLIRAYFGNSLQRFMVRVRHESLCTTLDVRFLSYSFR